MKTVIEGLEEGLNAIAEALEGGGGGGSSIVPTPTAQDEGKVLTAGDDGTASWETSSGGGGIPTPTLDDDGKVLRVVSQSQERVAPEWDTIREVPIGGQNGQVLTATSEGYEWADASGGGGGGGHVDVVAFYIAKDSFTQDGQVYTTAFASEDDNILRKINNVINLSIVDTADPGYPTIINPATDECSIWYESDLVNISVSATVYAALGSREKNTFYMTYYKY